MKKYRVTTSITVTMWVNDEEDIDAELRNILNTIDAEDDGYVEYEECD